jgi:hypothetical protein
MELLDEVMIDAVNRYSHLSARGETDRCFSSFMARARPA